MTAQSGRLLHAVEVVARIAAGIALRHFRKDVAIETKPDGTPVTQADRDAESAAREWIARMFPTDGIVGEELGTVRGEARRKWFLDPIDGTRSFVQGVPLWGTLVAVADGDEVVAGSICCPAVDEMVTAARGEGCWWNGHRCAVSPIASLARATVVTTDEHFASCPERRSGWRRITARAALARSWGDCFGYLLVATGRAEVMADPVMAAWDSAALLPIIEEAGGVFTDWDGRPTAFGRSAVATNAALAIEVRAILNGSGTIREAADA